MSDQKPVVSSSNTPSTQETLVLLKGFQSLGFMMHTHHPATHVPPVLDKPTTGESVNVRNECPEDIIPPAMSVV